MDTLRKALSWAKNNLIPFFTFEVIVIYGYLIVTGFRQDATWVANEIAALSALFSAVSGVATLMQAKEIKKQREGLFKIQSLY